MIPGWLQTILLTLLLLFVSNRTARKGISQWQSEQKQRRAHTRQQAPLEHHESDDDNDHDVGILHEESFQHSKAGQRVEEAVQAALAAADHQAHSLGHYLLAAWRRLPAVKVPPATVYMLTSQCCNQQLLIMHAQSYCL